MSSRALPARPHLDHLKHEAKALLRAARAGDTDALRRIRDVVGDRPDPKLADAQRVIAREYGFRSWAQLRAHVQASRSIDDAVEAFLAAVETQDIARARQVLGAQPDIASESLHVAAVLGRADDVRRLISGDPSRVTERRGPSGGEPLLFLCYSPFHGESAEVDAGLLETARLLLDAGADANARDTRHGVPALYAVTGVHSVLPIARLLLDRGANPNDGESVFHAAERFHEDALEMLLAAGADLNETGEWGNTPLYFLLRWYDVERKPRVRQGFQWLLDHGADPNVPCGRERENSLHVAARLGQGAAIIELLLTQRADVHARRADGRTAWHLAQRGGFDEIAQLLERAGAEPQPLSQLDLLLAACGRGDADEARRLSSPALMSALADEDRLLLPTAAAHGRHATVKACIAAGFPPDTRDTTGATALHHAAIHGHAELLRALITAGGDVAMRDDEHRSTPLGWACFGADFIQDADGDYADCARVLLEAGAQLNPDEHRAAHEGVARVLQEFSRRA